MRTFKPEPMTEEQEIDWIEEIDTMESTLENIKRELNRKLMLAKKYGYDEYGDEVVKLMEMLNNVRKYGNQ